MKRKKEKQPKATGHSPLLINVAPLATSASARAVQIAPKGEYPHRRGLQVLDNDALRRIATDLATRNQEVVIDYGHGSLTAPDSEKGKAAGWIIPASAHITDGGVEAEVVWTDNARSYIRNGEYRYLSPVFEYDPARSKGGRLFITRLINAGLTNNPNIAAMRPISNQKEERTMDFAHEVRLALGLDDTATDEATLAALRQTLESSDEQSETLNSLYEQLTVENGLDASRRIAALALPDDNAARITELEKELSSYAEREGNRLVENALTEGKISPAQKQWAKEYAARDRDGFVAYCDNAHALPLTPSQTGSVRRHAPGGLSAAEQGIIACFSSINATDYLAV